ncbi:hypothetical protein GCM10018782_14030 [Streptomyces griseoaurantiacus]|nr:hypothetical protein GCM10018782_14030 [Streptomyces griseoaurantiacus]
MSDRPSRRSPPASSRSIAAARSSDWMFRAIAVLPSVPVDRRSAGRGSSTAFGIVEHYRSPPTSRQREGTAISGRKPPECHAPAPAGTPVRPVDASDRTACRGLP